MTESVNIDSILSAYNEVDKIEQQNKPTKQWDDGGKENNKR